MAFSIIFEIEKRKERLEQFFSGLRKDSEVSNLLDDTAEVQRIVSLNLNDPLKYDSVFDCKQVVESLEKSLDVVQRGCEDASEMQESREIKKCLVELQDLSREGAMIRQLAVNPEENCFKLLNRLSVLFTTYERIFLDILPKLAREWKKTSESRDSKVQQEQKMPKKEEPSGWWEEPISTDFPAEWEKRSNEPRESSHDGQSRSRRGRGRRGRRGPHQHQNKDISTADRGPSVPSPAPPPTEVEKQPSAADEVFSPGGWRSWGDIQDEEDRMKQKKAPVQKKGEQGNVPKEHAPNETAKTDSGHSTPNDDSFWSQGKDSQLSWEEFKAKEDRLSDWGAFARSVPRTGKGQGVQANETPAGSEKTAQPRIDVKVANRFVSAALGPDLSADQRSALRGRSDANPDKTKE